MRLLSKFVVVALVIAASPQLLDNIRVQGAGPAAVAAIVYGLLFVAIGWVVRVFVALLSVVPGVLTLGLFFLLVPLIANTVLLRMTAGLVPGFVIASWWSAFLLSVVLSIVNLFFERRER